MQVHHIRQTDQQVALVLERLVVLHIQQMDHHQLPGAVASVAQPVEP